MPKVFFKILHKERDKVWGKGWCQWWLKNKVVDEILMIER